MAAVPGVGAVVEVGKIANDFSKAYGATAEAAADVIEVASTLGPDAQFTFKVNPDTYNFTGLNFQQDLSVG